MKNQELRLMHNKISNIVIATCAYIPIMVLFAIGVYEIPESWYRNLVCPLSVSVITTVWGSLSLNWYDDYKELKLKTL
ncbi:MAG: hypothetical protein ABGY11_00030 [Candidatus Thioglobus sp.]|jgi:hypothetical protein